MYEELVRLLKDKAERFDYDGWVDTAVIMEKAADAIEELIPFKECVEKGMGLLEKADELLKAIKPRWIPVTEEPLLKVGDDGYNGYLVYANGYYEVADYAVDKYDNVPYFHVDGELETDVTHWMPLPQAPEPPKEEA